jgi:hypothetical protein
MWNQVFCIKIMVTSGSGLKIVNSTICIIVIIDRLIRLKVKGICCSSINTDGLGTF